MKDKFLIPASIVISVLIIAVSWIYNVGFSKPAENLNSGVVLPVQWGDLEEKMIEAGVIDEGKFEGKESFLNLLWAFGLANKNPILEEGPMADPRYGGAGRFASTGGWTLAKGDAMEHYSRHQFVVLTPEQQQLVEKVSKGIYRPCCDNSTYFPDCNHGMAMLGLLELLASQGLNEEEMYQYALQVNASWFPDTYLTIARYFQERGVDWSEINPKEILGRDYSSGSGYARILSQVTPSEDSSGTGCGV